MDDLPRLDVLQHWYEDMYENLEDDKLHQELEELLKPQDELEKALAKSSADSDMDKLEAEVKAQNQKSKDSPRPVKAPKIETEEMKKALEGLGKAINEIKDSFEPVTKGTEFSLDFSDLGET